MSKSSQINKLTHLFLKLTREDKMVWTEGGRSSYETDFAGHKWKISSADSHGKCSAWLDVFVDGQAFPIPDDPIIKDLHQTVEIKYNKAYKLIDSILAEYV